LQEPFHPLVNHLFNSTGSQTLFRLISSTLLSSDTRLFAPFSRARSSTHPGYGLVPVRVLQNCPEAGGRSVPPREPAFALFSVFFTVFSCLLSLFFLRLKQTGGETHMYEIETNFSEGRMVRGSNGDQQPRASVSAVVIFCRVFGEARERFAFGVRGFRLEEEWLSFYIRPADGLQFPAIMQWLKQIFSVRFNRCAERTGHVWGDRYWSRVVKGEPPEEAGEVDWAAVDTAAETGEISSGICPADGVTPPAAENPAETGFSLQPPARSPPPLG
jgi:hypothetical protein